MKYTLITGGSRGIGKALAIECARCGMNLLIVARQADALEAASKEITEAFSVQVHTLQADLSNPGAPQGVWEWCRRNGYRVDILINNAGAGGPAIFEESSPEYNEERILVNIRALVQLSHLFLPELRSHTKAHILNIGSLSAYYPLPYRSVYAASKAFVLSFSRALRVELKESRVRVTVVNPNGVRTNVGTQTRINSHPRLSRWLFIMDAEKVASISVKGMLKGKPVVVPGFMNRVLVLVARIVPASMQERQSSRIQRKELDLI